MPKPPETELLYDMELAVRCEKLEATNKELLDALEKISAKKDRVNYSQDDWMYQALDDIEIAEEAITNAKQVMGDSDGK